MSSATPHIAVDETPDEQAARERRMLKRLSEIGMTVAENLEFQVLEHQTQVAEARAAGAAPPAPLDLTAQFARISRAMRLTLARGSRLDEEREIRETRRQAAEDQRIAEALPRRVRAKRREVVDIFRRIGELNSDRESLSDGIEDLMESERYDEDLADMPFGAVIARISRDLGLDMDPDTWPANGAYDEDDALADPRAAEAFLRKLQAYDPTRTPAPLNGAPTFLPP